MLCEMLSLETNYPEVYQQFVEGNFTVQLSSKNTFGRMEPDKVNNILIPKAIVMQTFPQCCSFLYRCDANSVIIYCLLFLEYYLIDFVEAFLPIRKYSVRENTICRQIFNNMKHNSIKTLK